MSGDDDAAADEESEVVAVEEKLLHCACCGRTEIDDIKLKDCKSCDLVRYCSDACEANNKSEHEEDCMKRTTELRDELLFKQPESTHLGDCPICTIPLPLDDEKYVRRPCCFNYVCQGCMHQSIKVAAGERSGFPKCPFCREPAPPPSDINSFEKNYRKQLTKRIEANDPVAMSILGHDHCAKGDYSGAFELFTKAAQLGDMEAHYKLAIMYRDGDGVEEDEEKLVHHFEEAAMGGHPSARHDLAVYEFANGKRERAAKHWIIAANQGQDLSTQLLTATFELEGIEGGRRSFGKEDFAAALYGHQAAVKATKSPEREEAAAFYGREH